MEHHGFSALVKTPPLLILDEPCQGLDSAQTTFTLQMIDNYCGKYGASLIFVSHFPPDFPVSIRQTMHLGKGKCITR